MSWWNRKSTDAKPLELGLDAQNRGAGLAYVRRFVGNKPVDRNRLLQALALAVVELDERSKP